MRTLAAQYEIDSARDEIAWLENMLAGLKDGTVHWKAWNDELTCPSPADAAIDECAGQLDLRRRDLAALEAQVTAA
jgi:hypothetical protein